MPGVGGSEIATETEVMMRQRLGRSVRLTGKALEETKPQRQATGEDLAPNEDGGGCPGTPSPPRPPA